MPPVHKVKGHLMMRSASNIINMAAASLLLATGLWVLGTGAATADIPPNTGCPSNGQPGGWVLTSTSDLIHRGYSPNVTNFDVNADGYICVKPVSQALQDLICADRPGGVCTVPVIYYFRDNDVTSWH
jgi:hypothetical protein